MEAASLSSVKISCLQLLFLDQGSCVSFDLGIMKALLYDPGYYEIQLPSSEESSATFILILDLSFARPRKTLRAHTGYLLTLRYRKRVRHRVLSQNPISQLGIIGMRAASPFRISDMGGNPSEHLERLKHLREQEPQGSKPAKRARDARARALPRSLRTGLARF